jgi:hypothetical protein
MIKLIRGRILPKTTGNLEYFVSEKEDQILC